MTKILTTYRLNSFEWRLDGLKREIHSFPTMYIMGEGVVEMGQNNDFLKKSGLKTLILAVMVLDHLTSELAGIHNFKDIPNFHRCFKKSGTSVSK